MIVISLVVTIVTLMVVVFAALHFRAQGNILKSKLNQVTQELVELKNAPVAEPKVEPIAPITALAPVVTLKPIPHSVNPMPSPEVKRLFDRLEQMMETDGLFYQTGIGRKELSAKLCTNENYLYNIVRQATGMTLQEWINDKRLKYAKELLSTMKEFDVQQVAIASGFGTSRTLQRQLKKRYDTSPIDLYKSTH